MLLLLLLLLLSHQSVCQHQTPPCSPSPLSPPDAVTHDAFLLTSGEHLILTCGVCGICVGADAGGCADVSEQLWMTRKEMAKARIQQDNKYDSSWSSEVNSLGDAASRLKSLAANVKSATARGLQRLRLKTATAVHRFDRLRRLSDQSGNGVGLFKELRADVGTDAAVVWFHETPDGKVRRVKHESAGFLLVFDSVQVQRIEQSHTGVFTCQFNGRVRARFVVTVAAGGTEPFREFSPPTRSLRSKVMPKANLKVYTRWRTSGDGRGRLKTLLPLNADAAQNGTIAVRNITWQVGICYVQQLEPDKATKPETSATLKRMPHGLPCRSHLLPLSVKSLMSVIMRPSEIRKLGTVGSLPTSSLNFGGGQRTRAGTLPQVDLDMMIVRRSFDIVKEGEFVSLSCPLKRRARGLLVWFVLPPAAADAAVVNSSDLIQGILDPDHLRRRSRGRRFSDPGGNLNVASVSKKFDSYKYFCLDENKIVGYVKLIVRDNKAESYAVYATDQALATISLLAPVVMVTSIVALAVIAASPLYEPPLPW